MDSVSSDSDTEDVATQIPVKEDLASGDNYGVALQIEPPRAGTYYVTYQPTSKFRRLH